MSLKILTVLLLSLSVQTLTGQERDTITGKLNWNLTEFEGFYGLDDTMVTRYKELLKEIYQALYVSDSIAAKSLKAEYDAIEKANLLYSPCEFIVTTEDNYLRIYFTGTDYKQIQDSHWFNKMKTENLHTYITIVAAKVTDDTFLCKELISLEQRKLN